MDCADRVERKLGGEMQVLGRVLGGPDEWTSLLDAWVQGAGGLEPSGFSFPYGCAHWYIPSTSGLWERGPGERYGTKVVTFIRGHVDSPGDWVPGWADGRLDIKPTTRFRTVQVRLHQSGGAGVVGANRCPSWFTEGFMPEVPPALSRRLDTMYDVWRLQEDVCLCHGSDEETEATQEIGKKRSCKVGVAQGSVQQPKVSWSWLQSFCCFRFVFF